MSFPYIATSHLDFHPAPNQKITLPLAVDGGGISATASRLADSVYMYTVAWLALPGT